VRGQRTFAPPNDCGSGLAVGVGDAVVGEGVGESVVGVADGVGSPDGADVEQAVSASRSAGVRLTWRPYPRRGEGTQGALGFGREALSR
jgi:hypothetical protein